MTKTDIDALTHEAVSYANKLLKDKPEQEALSVMTISLVYALVKTSQTPVHAFLGAEIATDQILKGIKLFKGWKELERETDER